MNIKCFVSVLSLCLKLCLKLYLKFRRNYRFKGRFSSYLKKKHKKLILYCICLDITGIFCIKYVYLKKKNSIYFIIYIL